MIITILDFLPFFRSALWLTGLSGGAGFVYNSKKGRFETRNLKCFSAIASILICGAQFTAVSLRLGGVLLGSDPALNHITSLLIYIATAAAYFMGIVAFRKADEIVVCFNSLIQIEEKRDAQEIQDGAKKRPPPRKNWRDLVTYVWGLQKGILADLKEGEPGRFIIMSSSFCQVTCPLLIFFFLLGSPCSNQVFIRSTLADCPSHGFKILPSSLAPIVILVDIYYIFCAWSQGCIGIGSIFYTMALCIRDLLKRILATAQHLPDQVSIIHNVRAYEEVQLLERQYNNINRGGSIIIVMADMTFLGVTSLYTVIALHDVVPLPILGLSIIMAVETVLLAQMFMYGAAADLHTISDGIKKCWNFNRTVQRDKYLKRLTNSCNVMKTMVGNSGNYVDKTTPLVASQMTVDQTASLLLMTAQKN